MNKRGARRLTALLLTAAFMLIMLPAGGLTMTYTPSSSYASGQYYTRLRAVQLTGNQRQDLVNVALSQLGYHEGNSASQLGGNSTSGEYDYTEYGYWYGKIVLGRDSGLWGAWCAMFVSWCSRQAGISKNIISNACYAHAGSSTYYFNNLTFRERGTYTPVPGDLVFFDWPNQEGEWNHVGIVYVVTSSFVYTIEGNTLHDCVEIRCFRITEPIIKGYGVPAYTSSGTVTPSVSVNDIPVYDYYDPINHAKPKGTISNGTSGEGTSWPQCALNYLGYPLTIDGEFGSATEAALRAFQADHGLTVNGICTLAVVNYIQSLLDAY
ncbi:MAG: CHAP domain-containing protein, partial [Clostridia bacterium]|nr:CHAP domain-containing protein [Clostridia bacterium]